MAISASANVNAYVWAYLICLWLLAPLKEILLVIFPYPLHLQQTVWFLEPSLGLYGRCCLSMELLSSQDLAVLMR